MEIGKLIVIGALAAPASLFGQSNWPGIQPGISTRADLERVAGKPVQAVTETLAEYKGAQPGDRAFVQYRTTGVVERVEMVLANPLDRATLIRNLNLNEPEVRRQNARGQTEELFGSRMIVLTLGSSGVERCAYYSRDLFESAGGRVSVSQAGNTVQPRERPLDEAVRSEPPPLTRPQPPSESSALTIPAGTSLVVRLAEKLSTDRNNVGDRFHATLDQPLIVDGTQVAGRGADVEGRITNLLKSGRVKGLGEMHLELTSLRTFDGHTVAISTSSFVQTAQSTAGSDAKKIGVAAGIGAAIGAIAAGGRGAAIGAGAGGAAATGVALATRGKPAELAVETQVTFQLAVPVPVVSQGRR